MSSGESTPILIPREMVNDEAYRVLSLLALPGEMVEAGDPIAELETSKATFVLSSPARGYFRPSAREGESVPVGGMFGYITDSPEGGATPMPKDGETVRPAGPSLTPAEKNQQKKDPRFSDAAWSLFSSSGLELAAFARFALVAAADVEAAIASAGEGGAAAPLPDPAALTPAEKAAAVILLGGGGHARECMDIIEISGRQRIFGIIDTRRAPGATVDGYTVLGDNAVLPGYVAAGLPGLVLAYGIAGSPAERGEHFRRLLAAGHIFPPIVHPKAAVNRTAVLGAGTQVMACAVVGSRAVVGEAGIINSGAVVSHDCVLEENVHVAPGAVLAGGVRVGRDTVVGMGATVYMRVRIGRGAVIHNGANVFADVPDGAEVKK